MSNQSPQPPTNIPTEQMINILRIQALLKGSDKRIAEMYSKAGMKPR